MIPELGHIALIIAFVLSFLLGVLPLMGSLQFGSLQPKLAINTLNLKPISLGVTFFVTLAFLALLYSFAHDDFSVRYVAMHSNSSLPFFYKLSALWAGHEGSLLLWIFILWIWTLMLNITNTSTPTASFPTSPSSLSSLLPLSFLNRMLACLGWVSFGLLLFLLATSNPFTRYLPDIPLDGVDLNPLLQDPGLIFHPPLLYMGYVGSVIPAAFAVSALWENSFPPGFADKVRPWVLAAFAFLTLGIAWGSFWAYYELGWGGWWFWDPVENASFMPWLTGIALIHSLIVLRKRKQFYAWTLLLMIICFGLSLLGTFLVRSGVLASVHAFATDPRRGVFILMLLVVYIGAALILYGFRGKTLFKEESPIALKSREAILLFISILIMVAVACILLGTLFPLIYDFFTGKKISVGFPYFNLIFIPLMIPVLFAVPFGPFLRWGDNSLIALFKKMRNTLVLSLLLSLLFSFIVFPFLFQGNDDHDYLVKNISIVFWLFLAFWLALGTLHRLQHKMREQGIKRVSVGAWGIILAHFGVAVMVFGMVVVSYYQIEKDLRLSPGDQLEIADYQISFLKSERLEGSNFVGYKAAFTVERKDNKGKGVAALFPEKRNYVVQNTTMTETAIDPGFLRDIYIALGDRLPDNSWTVRIYYKPGVRWIWWGAVMIAFACFLLVGARFKGKYISSV